ADVRGERRPDQMGTSWAWGSERGQQGPRAVPGEGRWELRYVPPPATIDLAGLQPRHARLGPPRGGPRASAGPVGRQTRGRRRPAHTHRRRLARAVPRLRPGTRL